MSDRYDVFIALGGNLGDVANTFDQAIELISAQIGKIQKVSRFIRTKAMNPPGVSENFQPDYLNGVLACLSEMTPEHILRKCHEIEGALGLDREKKEFWGPRPIDLDLLFVGDLIVNSESLILPHPELHKRNFVLRPLQQIAPNLLHPVFKKSISILLKELELAD